MLYVVPLPKGNQSRVLMFQGTGSDVGKSLIVSGVCRFLVNLGLRVRPFKPQTLQEQRIIQWEKELEEIQEWLDK